MVPEVAIQEGNRRCQRRGAIAPVAVVTLLGITVCSATTAARAATPVGGIVAAWGDNSDAQLGLGSPLGQGLVGIPVPTFLSKQSGVTGVAAGGSHSLALKSGNVFGWGRDFEGQLGDGGSGVNPAAVEAKTNVSTVLSNVIAVAAGTQHSLALTSRGNVYAFGSNAYGQLGNGTTTGSSYAVEVMKDSTTALTNIVAIAAGGFHSLALDNSGNVWAWGDNGSGELGNNTTTGSSYPIEVETYLSTFLSNVIDIAAGRDHALALKSDGSVWAWGSNASGQLGDKTLGSVACSCRQLPVQVQDSFANLATGTTTLPAWPRHALAAGDNHSVVLKWDGTVWAWGSDSAGQLGDATFGDPWCNCRVAATEVIRTTGLAQSVSAGGAHSLALMATIAQAWGDDRLGQLGDGTIGDVGGCYCRTTPVNVLGFAHGIDVSGGGAFSLGVM